MEDPARSHENDVEIVFVRFAPMQFAGDAAHVLGARRARAGEEKREPEASGDALPDRSHRCAISTVHEKEQAIGPGVSA